MKYLNYVRNVLLGNVENYRDSADNFSIAAIPTEIKLRRQFDELGSYNN